MRREAEAGAVRHPTMTTFRFRVKFAADPTALWRDILVGEDRALTEFQAAINRAMGLDQDHLWFFGTDQDYWDSRVQYKGPLELERTGGGLGLGTRNVDASETTVGQFAAQLGLGERDRFCYLFDYGDGWRFYGICKEIDPEGPPDHGPEVVKRKGDPVDQYAPYDERW